MKVTCPYCDHVHDEISRESAIRYRKLVEIVTYQCDRYPNTKPYQAIDHSIRDYSDEPRGWQDRTYEIHGNAKPVTWNGITYRSNDAAAKANHCHPTTMSQRIKRGYTCDDDLYQRKQSRRSKKTGRQQGSTWRNSRIGRDGTPKPII